MMFGSIWDGFGMVDEIHTLIEEADVVVTYNGDRFDLTTLNKEFILAGFTPPAPYKSVDVYKIIKQNFRFTSNKLQYVGEILTGGGKVKHEGHDLWVKVRAGDKAAQAQMEEYCKGDVSLLQEVFLVVQPWAKTLPNYKLYVGSECPKCDNGDLEKRGFAYTLSGTYQRFRCKNCGGWSKHNKRLAAVDVTGI